MGEVLSIGEEFSAGGGPVGSRRNGSTGIKKVCDVLVRLRVS